MRPPLSAIPPPPARSLEEAYDLATVTVLATVKNVRPGRVIKGPAGDLQCAVIELNVLEVLNGALEPTLKGKVEVSFAANWAPEPIDPVVQQMRANMPSEPSVWLLEWSGNTEHLKPGVTLEQLGADLSNYTILDYDTGVFVEDNGVLTSGAGTLEGPRGGARKEAEGLGTLDALAENARKHR
jgi:hypothetical protein